MSEEKNDNTQPEETTKQGQARMDRIAHSLKIEKIRADGVRTVAMHNKELIEHTNGLIDKLIKLLQNNRGHIAGMLFVAIPAEGTQLVDHEGEGEGVWAIQMTSSGTAMTDCMLKEAAEELVEDMGFKRFHDSSRRGGFPPTMPDSLKALLKELEK